MIEINLIPDVKREYLKTKLARNAVVTISVFVGVAMAGLAVILGTVVGSQLIAQSIQDRTIKEDSAKLMNIQDIDKMVTIQQQLETIGGQFDSRHISSRLFDVLSAINPESPNNVTISTLKLNPEEKTVSIEGSAVNGYMALEVFKKTIVNTKVQLKEADKDVNIPLAQDIKTGDTSFGESAEGQRVLRFAFTFTYPNELFSVSESTVTIVTPQGKIDVTDSKLGVPDSLFGARATDTDGSGGGE